MGQQVVNEGYTDCSIIFPAGTNIQFYLNTRYKAWSGLFPDDAHIGEINIKTRKAKR